MATIDKNFRVKNGINVGGSANIAGSATFQSDVNVNSLNLNSTPINFNSTTNRLQIYINGAWKDIAFTQDVANDSTSISFMDIGLAIDYNGLPIYTVYANGVNTTATKFADGATPSTEQFALTFDSGTV
jgi:hypothetical protein